MLPPGRSARSNRGSIDRQRRGQHDARRSATPRPAACRRRPQPRSAASGAAACRLARAKSRDLRMQLQGAHAAAEPGQAGRQVTRAGADLQHLLAASQPQLLQDAADQHRPQHALAAGQGDLAVGKGQLAPARRARSARAGRRATCRGCARRARPRRAAAARSSARGRIRSALNLIRIACGDAAR